VACHVGGADAGALFGGTNVSFRAGSLRVQLYTNEGIASGVVPDVSRFKDHLETSETIILHGTRWQPLSGGSESPGQVEILVDDVVIAVATEESHGPVHATWHSVRLEAGPYLILGELATMPGFDPGRALTRPSGEFVVLRDVRISLLAQPDLGEITHEEALINRYDVDLVDADLMLGFFFPGAHVEPVANPGPPQPVTTKP
jgi:hypothetical protein